MNQSLTSGASRDPEPVCDACGRLAVVRTLDLPGLAYLCRECLGLLVMPARGRA